MTIPMESNRENSSREHAQRLFKENLVLENKRRKAVQTRSSLDPCIWQNMLENYEVIVLEDHDFSEQHDIEFALWQLHYQRIEELRALFNAAVAAAVSGLPPNGKVPVRSGPEQLPKIRSKFKSFLTEATGFYHDLMMKIRAKYGLPLRYFSDVPAEQIPSSKIGSRPSEVEKGLISCHRCLIYLGDLARYKGLYGEGDSKSQEFSAASSYYMHASSLWSSSGNSHHQLAILAGYSNDELLSIYRYFRSLAVDSPFTTARDNLIIAFEKNRQNYNQLIDGAKAVTGKTRPIKLAGKGRSRGQSRIPIKGNKVEALGLKERTSNYPEIFRNFTTRFIRLHGILFSRTSLEIFREVMSTVKNDLMELLSSGPEEEFTFGSDAAECKLAIVRISVILIFTVQNVSKENANQSYADMLQRSVLLQNACTAAFESMGCIVERCSQLRDPTTSFLLPGILMFLEWLACHQDVAVGNDMEEKEANARAFFWKRCVSFLNRLLSNGYVLVNEDEDESCFVNMSSYDESETSNRLALPEDFELRGFVPLLPAQLILDFSKKMSFGADYGHKEKVFRIQRVVAAGKALANAVWSVKERFYFDSKLKTFDFGSVPKTPDVNPVSSPLNPDLSAGLLDTSTDSQIGIAVSPKTETNIDTEDDEEIIVFKPFKAENNVDGASLKMASSANFSPVCDNGQIDFGTDTQSSFSHDGFMLQSTIGASTAPPAAFYQGIAVGTSQSMLGWSSDIASAANALDGLNLGENQAIQVPKLQGDFGIMHPAAAALPIPQFPGIMTSRCSLTQSLQTHLPFESTLPIGSSVDVPSVKHLSIVPPGLKKVQSRHVRHVGPPPGFGSVPLETVDDPSYNVDLINDNFQPPALDDYSWLDGYKQSSSSHSLGLCCPTLPSSDEMGPAFYSLNQPSPAIHSMNQMGPTYTNMNKMNGLVADDFYPFPGKPVSFPELYDLPFSEHMKHYGGMQQQFHKGNQQTVYAAQPFQGSSVWESRFFV